MNDDAEKIRDLKKLILQTAYKTREGHIPSAFSILDILYVLYNSILNVDPKLPNKADRDYLIVSKGHSAIGLYAVLADRGFFSVDELKTFGRYKSRLGGHPDFNKVPGVEASTGSLGHGFPMSVGMAMGIGYRNDNQRVFCIIGDGELNEGSMWEAFAVAGQHRLKNLVSIVDYNHSLDRSITWGDIGEKIGAFGWDTAVVDGHDHRALRDVLSRKHDRPFAVVANTVKGKGCATMERDPSAWHHKFPTEADLQILMEEISK